MGEVDLTPLNSYSIVFVGALDVTSVHFSSIIRKIYFNPFNNNLTKVALVLQCQDESGRFHTNWLGEIESNFLGCHIRPYEISPEKHDYLRLNYKDSTSHSVINVEGLSMKKIVQLIL